MEHYYPFLDEASQEISSESLGSVLQDGHKKSEPVKGRALERIENSLNGRRAGDPVDDEDVELLSYPVARIYVSIIDEYQVISSYATGEAKEAVKRVKSGDLEIREILEKLGYSVGKSKLSDLFERSPAASRNSQEINKKLVADYVGKEAIDLQKTRKEILASLYISPADKSVYTVDVEQYLSMIEGVRETEFELANRGVREGKVYVSKKEMWTLLESIVRRKVADGLPIDSDAIEKIVDNIEDITEDSYFVRASERVPDNMISTDINRVDEDAFPPVISEIIGRIRSGENVKHEARFAVASFLISIGMTNEEILDLLGIKGDGVPAFVEEQTLYQLNHIRSSKDDGYTPPTYETIRSWGISWETDALEETVSHPLGYYRIKLEEKEHLKSDES